MYLLVYIILYAFSFFLVFSHLLLSVSLLRPVPFLSWWVHYSMQIGQSWCRFSFAFSWITMINVANIRNTNTIMSECLRLRKQTTRLIHVVSRMCCDMQTTEINLVLFFPMHICQ